MLQLILSPILGRLHPEIRLTIAQVVKIQSFRTLLNPNSLRHFANLKFKPYLKRINFEGNTNLLVDINDFIGYQSAINGKWDSTCFNLVKKSGFDIQIFFDIGANIGTTCIPIAKTGIRVIAFEPNKELGSILLRNVFLNSINNLDFVNMGISGPDDLNSMAKLQTPVGNKGASSILSDWRTGKSLTVSKNCRLSTIDATVTYFGHKSFANKRILIKIDVEGFEREVLNGSKETINRNRPIVIFENNPKQGEDSQFSMKYFNKIFQKYDFFEIDENLILSDFEPTRTCNAIAIPNNLTKKLRY